MDDDDIKEHVDLACWLVLMELKINGKEMMKSRDGNFLTAFLPPSIHQLVKKEEKQSFI